MSIAKGEKLWYTIVTKEREEHSNVQLKDRTSSTKERDNSEAYRSDCRVNNGVTFNIDERMPAKIQKSHSAVSQILRQTKFGASPLASPIGNTSQTKVFSIENEGRVGIVFDGMFVER